jgi:hypothetical protein
MTQLATQREPVLGRHRCADQHDIGAQRFDSRQTIRPVPGIGHIAPQRRQAGDRQRPFGEIVLRKQHQRSAHLSHSKHSPGQTLVAPGPTGFERA